MTPEEELAYERRIADVLAIRGGREEPPRAGGLQTWLNSSVVVAVVGVLGTGVAGAWITNTFQQNAKRNEIERAAAEKRASDQNAATLAVLSIVANQSSAVDDLLTITNSSYSEQRYRGKELERLVAWKQEIRSKHDEADSAWRRDLRAAADATARVSRVVHEHHGSGSPTRRAIGPPLSRSSTFSANGKLCG